MPLLSTKIDDRVRSGPVVDELMRLTDDNCDTTCGTACPATGC
ncbi:MAG: FxLD family lanthipeptide [Pseudonocardiaceae bacterium]